ncbi:hypothetical protein G3T36_18040 [Diaminobutyricibacter tongyongensis]|uniref:Uncharacterized protein n=1 Tax=Leifsonia tongyongensis TaxID=1268043 RepID=A0A6L9Y248_9MICO|nr:hypothetical protein [Diaminobutyricibacter tongyongensis]NEN07761.1 hypothetical protein [Diaminobutyricibacter tongyongensis]
MHAGRLRLLECSAAGLAAQVFTARDAIAKDSIEDLRVAYILLDSAIETLMVRRVSARLIHGDLDPEPRSWFYRERDRIAIDLHDPSQRSRMEGSDERDDFDVTEFVYWRLSKTQLSDIERDFTSKLQFLAWLGDLDEDLVSVVSRLHEYRNEMYHREKTRPEALRALVHLYAWLTAEFMERLRPAWMGYGSDADEVRRGIYRRIGIQEPPERPTGFFDEDLQGMMASELRRSLDLEDAAEVFAAYVTSRVTSFHDALEFVGDYLATIDRSVERISEMDVVRRIFSKEFMGNLKDLRRERVSLTRSMISRWDGWSLEITSQVDALRAFAALAEFEREFEPFETEVQESAAEVDREIQLQIDIARGK